ncbi:MAG: nuclear transport factor 2 family protein [Pseudomonadota bacterium]|nr:nuclear transport factor 2 family protein [Pseudomonadota bacterium]
MDQELFDRLAIRELVENWALWRDAGFWEKFRTCWHDDGVMMATWTQGTGDEFVEITKKGFYGDSSILHFLGGTTVELNGDRAIVQTKMTISQRAPVHEVWVDVVCTGRFYDFIEKRAGVWRVRLRQPIYEKDRIDPIEQGATLDLDPDILALYPKGYQHLAYLQLGLGFDVKRDMPGLLGERVEELYAAGAAWLNGGPINWS